MTLFSDVVDREAAWLSTSGDALPDLTQIFTTIAARRPRTPAKRSKQLFVFRRPHESAHYPRVTNQRTIPSHALELEIWWPVVTSGTGSGEADFLACEQAIDLVVARILGLVGDHTHGGRFLSAGEGREGVRVDFPDPDQAYAAQVICPRIFYSVDDFDVVN